MPNAGWAPALVGTSRQRRSGANGARRRNAPTASWPRNQVARGGIANAASWVSIARIASTSIALPRVDVGRDDAAQALVAQRAQGRLLALLGQQVVDRPVGALQGAGDRGRRGVERLGDLGGREAEHVAQDQHRALARGQVLERGDERELDALALLVARLGPARPSAIPAIPSGSGSSQTDSASGSLGRPCASAGGP